MRVYRERLGVPAWWWLAMAVSILFIGSMLWLGLGVLVMILVYVILGGGTAALLLTSGKATIEVTDAEIVVAGRRLPLTGIGEVSALDASQTRSLRFAEADPAAYLLARPYLPRSVYIEVAGRPADCPYWLIGSRRPGELAAAARIALGTRTIFNLLGPISNPAGAKRQLVGVFAPAWVKPIAEVLGKLGSERAWVVHGEGLDELTTTGTSFVAELKGGKVKTFEVTPEMAGLPRASLAELKGGEPAENAAKLRAILDGEPGPLRDIVLLNAAAALIVAGKAKDLRAGVELASASVASGAARRSLDKLVAITNETGAKEAEPA